MYTITIMYNIELQINQFKRRRINDESACVLSKKGSANMLIIIFPVFRTTLN